MGPSEYMQLPKQMVATRKLTFITEEGNLNKESLSRTPMPDYVMATRKSGAALNNDKGSESFTQALRTPTSGCTEAYNQSLNGIDSFTCGNKLSPKACGPAHPDSSDSTPSRELSDFTSWGATSPPPSQDPETPEIFTGHKYKTRSLSNRRKRSLRSSTAQDQRTTFSSTDCGDLKMGIGSSRHTDLADPFGAESQFHPLLIVRLQTNVPSPKQQRLCSLVLPRNCQTLQQASLKAFPHQLQVSFEG